MIVSLLLARLLLLLALPLAQDDEPTLEAEAGYDGLYETLTAIPVVVTARNDGAPVDGEIRVLASAEPNGLVYSAPLSLPTGSDKRVPLVVYTPPFGNNDLLVQIVSEGVVIAETRTNRLNSIGRDDLFYGAVTPDPGGLAFLETIPGDRADAAVAFVDLADLSEVSSAWNGLDIVILDDTDTSRLTTGQIAALRAWIESGGLLVVTGGPGGPQTAAGVADLLPVTVTGVESVDDLPAVSEYAGEPFESSGPYVVTTSSLTSGKTIIEQDGLPILAHREMGRGGVYFLALDPKATPLAGWSGAETIWAEIATSAPATPPWAWGIQDGYAASQAVSYIPGLSLPSVWQLILFVLLYTLVIGPINFLVLRRLNRRELAWITIPALVLLFSAVTFFAGFRARGNDATLNIMSVSYGSINAERLRTQSVLGLYSPRRALYDVVLPYDTSAYPFQQAFGTLVGGNNLDAINRATDVTLRDVRTDTSEIATFITQAHLPRPPITAEATLSAGGDTVEITVRNGTAGTLENAVIIYGQEQAALGNVAPGQEQTIVVSLIGAGATIPTPDPLFPTGSIFPNPILNDPSLILGTMDYFNDPAAYPRWQLIQSHYTGETVGSSGLPDPAEIVTLGGWLAGSAQEAEVSGDETEQSGMTLLLLEIPVQ